MVKLDALTQKRREWTAGNGMSFGSQQTAVDARRAALDGWLTFDEHTARCRELQREIDAIVVLAVAKLICEPNDVLDSARIANTLARPEYERQWRDTEKKVDSIAFEVGFWLVMLAHGCVLDWKCLFGI